MLPVTFHPAAREEVLEARAWYDGQYPKLGVAFVAALEAAVDRISENPLQFPVVHRDLRRVLLRRFPYAVFFRVMGDGILILACFHARRNPRIWQSRSNDMPE